MLITGDHPATARSIAVQAGIASTADQVVDARDVQAMTPGVLPTASVIARATPSKKVSIVDARRGGGAIVAMTGDGVNDAPALQRLGHRRSHGQSRNGGRQAGRRPRSRR